MSDSRGEVEARTLSGSPWVSFVLSVLLLASWSLFLYSDHVFRGLWLCARMISGCQFPSCQWLRCSIFSQGKIFCCLYFWMELMLCAPAGLHFLFHWPLWALPKQPTIKTQSLWKLDFILEEIKWSQMSLISFILAPTSAISPVNVTFYMQ